MDDRLDIELYSAPASEPITTAEAKTHCRVSTSADDTYIDTLITAARLYVEGRTGRALVTQTWKLYLDSFPDDDNFPLPRFPVASVTHVKYYDTDGTQQTWNSSNYHSLLTARPPLIALAPDIDWPDTQDRYRAVEIQFIAGQAAASVPADVKQLVKFLVAHWYESREPVINGTIVAAVPMTVDFMIQNLKQRGLR